MVDKRNSEGYWDPTAYKAIKNIEDNRRNKKMGIVHRGEIYYVKSYYTTGSEQKAGRPAVIVSNEKNNEFAEVVEVVYLTTRQKKDLPTHVSIRSTGHGCVVLCEQITSVSKERLGDYAGKVTASEMANIETAMMISLQLDYPTGHGNVADKFVKALEGKQLLPQEPVKVEQPKAPEIREVVKTVEVKVPDPEAEVKIRERDLTIAGLNAKLDMLTHLYNDLLVKTLAGAR